MITLRIFLSSTFKDMAAERDELVRRRFPALRAWAEGLGVHLVEVDLRWGVTNPSSLDACLTEVDDCRPLFVCFLGHHFGSQVSPGALTEELRARYPWIAPERHLECSYTELEIIHAALREDAPPMDSLFYFRHPRMSREVEEKLGMRNEDAARQAALKQRIRQSGAPVREDYTSAGELGEWLEKDLRAVISARAAEARPGAGWMARRGRRWAGEVALMERLGGVVLGHWQPGWMRRLTRAAAPSGVVVSGGPGCGKSTFLAAWARLLAGEQARLITPGAAPAPMPVLEKLRALRPAILCLSAEDDPPGAPDESAIAWPRLARRVLEFIRREWARDLAPPPEGSPMALLHALPGALERIPAGARLLLVVDGLDLLPDRSRADALAWLPAKLPPQVCVVASLGAGAAELVASRGWAPLELPPRPAAELLRPWLAAVLGEHGKHLTPEQSAAAETLLAGVPARWMGLVLADLRGIGVRRLLMPRLEALALAAGDPAVLGRVLLEGLARQQGARLVWRALALLMEARTGLLEMEWRALLRPRELEVLPSQAWSPVFHALRDWLLPSAGVQSPSPELRLAWETWLAARPPSVARARRERARERLVTFFSDLGAASARALEQLPWFCRHAPELLGRLLSPPWLGALFRDRPDETRLLWRLLDDAAFSRVQARWGEQFINLDADGWHALATEAARRRELPSALDAARRAQELGCKPAALAEAGVLRHMGRENESIACLRRLIGSADIAEPAATQARLQLAEWLFEKGDRSEAADLAREALSRASGRGEPGLWMQACALLGNSALHGDAPASALPFFQELERLAGLTGAQRELIVAQLGIGDALGWLHGRRREAIRVLREATAAARRAGDEWLYQSALGSLIRVLRDEPGGVVEATSLVVERLALTRSLRDPAAEAQALFQYALLHQDRGEAGSAHDLYQQALALAHRTGQPGLARECEAPMR